MLQEGQIGMPSPLRKANLSGSSCLQDPISVMKASPAGLRGSDSTGAAGFLDSLSEADWLLLDRGYDADWMRNRCKAEG
jgi:hypothetical protein